jgi:hypothetical protein
MNAKETAQNLGEPELGRRIDKKHYLYHWHRELGIHGRDRHPIGIADGNNCQQHHLQVVISWRGRRLMPLPLQ